MVIGLPRLSSVTASEASNPGSESGFPYDVGTTGTPAAAFF